jgi:1,4-alpha-glucan branching enzyme
MAEKRDKMKVTFKLHEPSAHEVFMAGSLRDGTETTRQLKRCKDGTWRTTLTLNPGIHEYRIIVSGTGWNGPGPAARRVGGSDVFNCVVWV